MSEFIIKETIYADQDPESYFSQIVPGQYGGSSYVGLTFLDAAKKFKTKVEAEAILKKKEFEQMKCVVVEYGQEVKNVKKGFYLVGNKIKFHYVPKNYPLNGKSDYASESVLKDLIEHVREEIAREIEELRSNFSWAHDLEDQVNKKESGILKKYGLDT